MPTFRSNMQLFLTPTVYVLYTLWVKNIYKLINTSMIIESSSEVKPFWRITIPSKIPGKETYPQSAESGARRPNNHGEEHFRCKGSVENATEEEGNYIVGFTDNNPLVINQRGNDPYRVLRSSYGFISVTKHTDKSIESACVRFAAFIIHPVIQVIPLTIGISHNVAKLSRV